MGSGLHFDCLPVRGEKWTLFVARENSALKEDHVGYSRLQCRSQIGVGKLLSLRTPGASRHTTDSVEQAFRRLRPAEANRRYRRQNRWRQTAPDQRAFKRRLITRLLLDVKDLLLAHSDRVSG